MQQMCFLINIQMNNYRGDQISKNSNAGMKLWHLGHIPTDLGDEAAILVNMSAINVAPVSTGRGWPRGRGWGAFDVC